jgi:hypothetical protein
MVIAVLEEIQRNCEHDNKSAEYFMGLREVEWVI